MAGEALTREALNRATLARQMLLAREKHAVPKAVEKLGALQAQEPKPPFLALWARLENFDRGKLAKALENGEVVRALMFRATLHVVTADDYAALRSSLDPVMTGAMAALKGRDQGLDLDTLLPAATKLLKKSPLTFNEIRAALLEEFPTVNERALGYATRLHLPLAMVPTDDRWSFPREARFGLGPTPKAKQDLDALARRYLAAFGPATAADLQNFTGLKGMKEVLEQLPGTVGFKDGRRTLFDLEDAPRPDPETEAPPRLLPDFDSLLLAHQDRTRVVADEHRKQLTTKNLRIKAAFLVDGFVAGTWSIERAAKKATLTIQPFGRLAKAQRDELADEAEKLLQFSEPEETRGAVAFA